MSETTDTYIKLLKQSISMKIKVGSKRLRETHKMKQMRKEIRNMYTKQGAKNAS